MNEKLAMDSVLSCTNSIITLLNYSIQQANNKNFRDTLIEQRNTLENLQWKVYLIDKEKGYYIYQLLLQVKQILNK